MKRIGLAVAYALAVAGPFAAPYADGMMPFTTFNAETKAIGAGLPCKWVSVGGKYAGGKYDFLCKGGVWATVSLFMDKASGSTDGVGEVRLHYREWDPKVHPNAGEAMIAQQFVNFVVERFVPGRSADEVAAAFWTSGGRSWSGGGVRVGYEFEAGKDYNVRKLEITGVGRTLVGKQGTVVRELEKAMRTPEEVKIDAARDTLRRSDLKETMSVTSAPDVKWRTPDVPGINLPTPQESGVDKPVQELKLPDNLPASPAQKTLSGKVKTLVEGMTEEEPELEKAHPAELNTAPHTESYKDVKAPPAVSETLVPDPEELVKGREKAPTNYSGYNKAEELTKDLELRALRDNKDTENKIKTEGEAKAQQTLKPPDQAAPDVKATPTPRVEDKGAAEDASVPGTGKVIRLEREDGGWSGGLNQEESNPLLPGKSPVRPLPQLRFVPKAEPLTTGDEVIQFEDEGSKL